MPFRQYPQPGRRYAGNPYAVPRRPAEYPMASEPFLHGLMEDIPLPNQMEGAREPKNDDYGYRTDNSQRASASQRPVSVLEFLKEHIKLEEIILIGLIFLLLNEAIEDELLLIILVYILLF